MQSEMLDVCQFSYYVYNFSFLYQDNHTVINIFSH